MVTLAALAIGPKKKMITKIITNTLVTNLKYYTN